MKKALLAISLGLILIPLVFAGCGKNVATAPQPSTGNSPATTTTSDNSSFNFILKYGVTAKNEIDTYQDKFTKDMISDPPITINLRLTNEEMERIYQKMIEIDFFSYPERFMVNVPPGEPTTIVTPFPIYQFTVEKDSQIKKLDWDDRIMNPDVKADRLRELINLIIDIIESKEDYKALPEPSGGYM
ncbi:MAG: hypothetical protein A2Z15_07880 [Chloroflexi bacterium RBG_16_50_11]|nr:MAG: hypothetical protein A2Z15_07880 [Chloroflexi bacterium RBG_16_50_11]